MDLILTSALKSAGSLILFSVIPITWWFISSRKKVSFFRYAGLHKPSLSARWCHVLIIAAAILLLSRFDWTVLIPSSDIAVLNQSESVSANADYFMFSLYFSSLSLIESFSSNSIPAPYSQEYSSLLVTIRLSVLNSGSPCSVLSNNILLSRYSLILL